MTDLTIRGAGIFGLTVAWEALGRGATVRLIDPGGAGAGASGGIVGALAPHTPDGWNAKKAMQLQSLLAHRTFWAEVDRTSGISSGYAATGRVQPLLTDEAVELARARADAAEVNWAGAARWLLTDLPGDFAPPSPKGLWVRDTLSAHINPRRACNSLAAALRVRGVEIETDAAEVGQVIHATGAAGLRELSSLLGQPVGQSIKGQAALLAHDAAGQPQVFADGLHIIPHLDGTTAIGSTTEREFDDPTNTDEKLETLIETAATVLPVLHGARVLVRWAGLRPRARSRAPMLGPWPDRPDHFIANGGFKIGFGMAPEVARLILDLVLDGRDAIPPDMRVEASLSTEGGT